MEVYQKLTNLILVNRGRLKTCPTDKQCDLYKFILLTPAAENLRKSENVNKFTSNP